MDAEEGFALGQDAHALMSLLEKAGLLELSIAVRLVSGDGGWVRFKSPAEWARAMLSLQAVVMRQLTATQLDCAHGCYLITVADARGRVR